jgi:hypothetical protein
LEVSCASPNWARLKKTARDIIQRFDSRRLLSNPSIKHISTPAFTRTMAANGLYNIYRLAVPVATGVIIANASLYDVKGGTRAVIFDRVSGVQEKVVNEGTHFLIPWLQRAIVYDVRTKPRNISTTTGSKDLQMVSLTLRVLHRPEVQKLPVIYQVFKLVSGHSDLLSNDIFTSLTVPTTTSVFSRPSETKSSKPSSPSSTPPSSSPSVKPSQTASAQT